MNMILLRSVLLVAALMLLVLSLPAADRKDAPATTRWEDVDRATVSFADTTPIVPKSPLDWPPDPPPPIVRDSGRSDHIPYLIITSPALKPVFDDFAAWKKRKGIVAQVVTTADIAAGYTGDSLQQKIRNCVRDYYVNRWTFWVLIGGDYRHVPATAVYVGHSYIHTDEFYVCLDYNWNEDGDAYFGEAVDYGDYVDAFAELAVGRIPAIDSNQARVFINKLIAYETDTTKVAHYSRALFTSSAISCPADDGHNTDYMSLFPSLFDKIYFHQAEPVNVKNALLSGQGIIINSSHSQGERNFLTYYVDAPPGEETRKGITNRFFDTTTTNGAYSIFINSTCHYGSILSDTTVARSYLFNPSGWGVGYFGPVGADKPDQTHELYELILRDVYSYGLTIGHAIMSAKIEFQHGWWLWPIDHMVRYAVLATQYFGDPQMYVFRATPKILQVTHPDWLPWGLGPQSFDVSVTSAGVPVDHATVCVSHDTDLYAVAYTNSSGIATVSIANVPEMPDTLRRAVSVTVSEPDCFTSCSVMRLTHCGIAGDANDDCACDVSDPGYIINWIFGAGPPPPVPNRGDPNMDCYMDISDAVYLIQYIFAGGPAPGPGCITQPPGGKTIVDDSDPNDHETAPNDLQPSDQVRLSLSTEETGVGANSQLIEINSQVDIYGLSVTLKAAPLSRLRVQSLLQGTDALRLFWRQTGRLVKIGLIDTLGQRYIPAGQRQLFRISGDFEIVYSVAATVTQSKETVRIRPTVTNSVAGVRGFSFEPNYPNPFNPATNLSFSIPRSCHVSLAIFNVLGQEVRRLVDRDMPQGTHVSRWDGTDQSGNTVASGIYFARLVADDFRAERKMMVVK